MSKTLIVANELGLIRGQRLLFKNLSFSLNVGEAIHLSGQNGSGKTSLFKILTGALTANQGVLTLLGKSPADFDSEDYRQLMYLGHQTAIKHELTVMENLRLNSQVFDNIKAATTQLKQALSTVGLERFAEQLAGKLSAGQKRRIMLARLGLCLNDKRTTKKLWLLDEPLTALDVAAIDASQAQIDRHLSLGGGVVFTSHQALHLSHPVQSLCLGEAQ